MIVFSHIGNEKLEIELKFSVETDIPIIHLERANQEIAQIVVVVNSQISIPRYR